MKKAIIKNSADIRAITTFYVDGVYRNILSKKRKYAVIGNQYEKLVFNNIISRGYISII